ncbi:unnamed protein product [Orchesella dallaii]|uniref:Integral membrane protein DGCR2/IDD n=1 Tax=Orchesella dallaii TaxID=48710 RepID=A0ABP1RYH8_9HEXA
MEQPLQDDCIDLHQKEKPNGTHFFQGPDNCTLCACDEWEPKFCKAELCSPPLGCKSFKVGNSCCNFICLDEKVSLNKTDANEEGPCMSYYPVPIEYPILILVLATAVLVLGYVFVLYSSYRERQRRTQGRINTEDCE